MTSIEMHKVSAEDMQIIVACAKNNELLQENKDKLIEIIKGLPQEAEVIITSSGFFNGEVGINVSYEGDLATVQIENGIGCKRLRTNKTSLINLLELKEKYGIAVQDKK